MPVVEDIKEEEEAVVQSETNFSRQSDARVEQNLQGDEAESLDGVVQRAVGVGPVLGGEDHRDEPEEGEDEVEDQNVTGPCAEEERKEEKGNGENGLKIGAHARLALVSHQRGSGARWVSIQ